MPCALAHALACAHVMDVYPDSTTGCAWQLGYAGKMTVLAGLHEQWSSAQRSEDVTRSVIVTTAEPGGSTWHRSRVSLSI